MAMPPQQAITDSDVLIDALRGVPDAVSLVAALRHGPGLRISIISAMELVVGCRDAAQLRAVRAFLAHLIIIPISSHVSVAACDLMERFSLSHSLGIPDALIAATALDLNLPLCTRNHKHFGMIPGLTITQPY